MDGVDQDGNLPQVIVMAATNRIDVLDPALVRAGRFDRKIHVGLPDFDGRVQILNVHLSRRPYSEDIDVHELAFETQRYSGAQLENLVNLGAMFAGRDGRDEIRMTDMEAALDLERLGPLRATPFTDDKRKRLAVQEGSTALAATLQPAIEPVTKVSIVAREKNPMGMTVVKFNESRELTKLFTRTYLEQQLLVVLAGRAGEEIIYGKDEMSTINQRRLVMARRIVQKMVASTGMTDIEVLSDRTLAMPLHVSVRSLNQFILPNIGNDSVELADLQMEYLLNKAYEGVKKLLEDNRGALDDLIAELLEKDELDGDQVRALVAKHGWEQKVVDFM
eukprot:TRINITY_DN6893_c2_g1_i1.p2 TRINITY_DN6893_c2_g1~~TRINITY_DN6893_c2_g1_i1.p2  ORF type:complete len:362 (-),score=92.60 TRINITY_DN6893_c2_g1_i1:193-1194(-)